MKHIVLLIDQLYSYGGIERLVAIKANYWSEVRNYKVTIISTEQDSKKFAFEISKKVEFIDLSINYNRNISYFSTVNLGKFLKNVILLNQVLKKVKPDFIIVASHIPITYFVNFIKANAVTVKEFHFTKFYTVRNFKMKVENYLLSKFNHLAVLSEEEATFYETANTVVIPNPFNEPKSTIDQIKIGLKANKALFLGRIAPVKNLLELIIIWSFFVKEYPDWILEIYGDSENDYGTSLKHSVQQLHLESNIIFKGATDYSANAINNSKIMLLTSHEECFPLVILESLAMGVPVFSYDCPTGPRNIITNGVDGKIIANKNRNDFVTALCEFAQSTNLQERMSANAFESIAQYRIDKIMNIWDNKIFLK